MDKSKALKILSQSHYRITRSRSAILEALFKFKHSFTATDLQHSIAKISENAKVDLVTIYRNLPLFEEMGIICRTEFSDHGTSYVLSTPEHSHHHHHIICRICNKSKIIELCNLDIPTEELNRMGYKDIQHRLEYSAVCPACTK
ncbi:MAG: transcriptional repressor [Bdellovibrionales bacterium]|nr:transcriptional repressor [Bdellovibrionales bacterium]